MKFDRLKPEDLEELSPWDERSETFSKSDTEARACARKSLELIRAKLPRLTERQAEAITDLIVDAYDFGWRECLTLTDLYNVDVQKRRASRGVAVRLAKEELQRQRILREFAESGEKATRKTLAKRLGVSLATVYRALPAKPTTRVKPSRRSS